MGELVESQRGENSARAWPNSARIPQAQDDPHHTSHPRGLASGLILPFSVGSSEAQRGCWVIPEATQTESGIRAKGLGRLLLYEVGAAVGTGACGAGQKELAG